jgi:hypothetical protein
MPDLNTLPVRDGLERADRAHWTRQPPQSDHARLRFLLTQTPDVVVLAARLGTTPRTLKRILDQQVRKCRGGLRQAIHAEVAALWQPRVRQRARQEAHGMRICFRGWFGFAAAGGSSDDGRVRMLTVDLRAYHVRLLFEAYARDAGEDELRRILADAIGVAYFNLPEGGPHIVRLNDIDFVDFDY